MAPRVLPPDRHPLTWGVHIRLMKPRPHPIPAQPSPHQPAKHAGAPATPGQRSDRVKRPPTTPSATPTATQIAPQHPDNHAEPPSDRSGPSTSPGTALIACFRTRPTGATASDCCVHIARPTPLGAAFAWWERQLLDSSLQAGPVSRPVLRVARLGGQRPEEGRRRLPLASRHGQRRAAPAAPHLRLQWSGRSGALRSAFRGAVRRSAGRSSPGRRRNRRVAARDGSKEIRSFSTLQHLPLDLGGAPAGDDQPRRWFQRPFDH
jgi:hypothetical protein